jgi:hypothetical protein
MITLAQGHHFCSKALLWNTRSQNILFCLAYIRGKLLKDSGEAARDCRREDYIYAINILYTAKELYY